MIKIKNNLKNWNEVKIYFKQIKTKETNPLALNSVNLKVNFYALINKMGCDDTTSLPHGKQPDNAILRDDSDETTILIYIFPS